MTHLKAYLRTVEDPKAAEIIRILSEALEEADEYLDRKDGVANYIGTGSILHRKFQEALQEVVSLRAQASHYKEKLEATEKALIQEQVEMRSSIAELEAENAQLNRRLEASLCRWEVVDNQFRTTREASLRARVKELEDLLDYVGPTLVWYHEGPYGYSPSSDTMEKYRKILHGKEGGR